MNTSEKLVNSNLEHAEAFGQGGMPMPPVRRVAILTFMDSRLHPERFLGSEVGDAHVIRNAGGRAPDDAIRSLIVSSQLIGTNEYLVIHHSDCGMLTFSNEGLRSKLATEAGGDASHIDFLPFTDLEDSVRDDVRRIRESPFISAGIIVAGYVYDVDTGDLTPVETAAA